MISFCLLKSGLDEQSALLNIRSQLPGHCITLQDVNKMPSKPHNFCIVSKFVSKVGLRTEQNLGVVLELVCKEGEHEYNVIFVKKIAEIMHKLILKGQISIGSYLSLQNPSKVALYEKTNVKCVQIEIGQQDNQRVIIWKSTSLFYIQPFLMQSTLLGYSHILFYELDYIGSKEHVLNNMCDLVLPYGPVKSLSEIAGNNGKSVALATFTRRISPMVKRRDCGAYLDLKFNEVLFESKSYVSTEFIAFFFDEVAKEINKAVNTNHIEPGDLVALICPCFERKTSAPINIKFSPHVPINLIVLKNQYPNREIGTKLCPSDINFYYSNDFNERHQTNHFDENYSPVEFLSLKNCINLENALLKIKHKLKTYGQVTSLKMLSEDNLESYKKGIIVSCFLKLIESSDFSEKNDKVTFYLREIDVGCVYGAYFKLVLDQRFGKPLYSAIKNQTIVRGDIICFVNPFVWKNPAYIPSNYEIDLSYLLEVAIQEKQRVAVFKLREIGKGINLQVKQSKLVKQDNMKYQNIQLSRPNKDFSYTGQLLETKPTKLLAKDPKNQLGNPKVIANNDDESFKTHKTTDALCFDNTVDKLSSTNFKKPFLKDLLVGKDHGKMYSIQNKFKRIKIDNDNVSLVDVIKTRDELKGTESPLMNANLIPEDCFLKSNHTDDLLKDSFTRYEQKFPTLPLFLTKPLIEQSLDVVSGFCKSGCKKMYPYSSIIHIHEDLSKPHCPSCSQVLKLDFCLEIIASSMGRLITLLLQGVEAEKYLNVTCDQFLNYNEKYREQIVKQFKDELEQNQKSGKGRTIETTDTTYWWYT